MFAVIGKCLTLITPKNFFGIMLTECKNIVIIIFVAEKDGETTTKNNLKNFLTSKS